MSRHISSKAKERLNQIFDTKNCGKIKIIEYITADNITIQFLETNIIKKQVKFCHINTGNVSHKQLHLSNNSNLRIGEKIISKYGELQEIIDYNSAKFITIKFEDGTLLENVTYQNFLAGTLLHPNIQHKSRLLLGIGYNPGGIYSSYDRIYNTWYNMLQRCYDKKYKINYPTYDNCYVDKRWFNFQIFAEWATNNNFQETYQLDKDILIKGNKVYSPDTCCFVPHEINILLTNNRSNRGLYPIGVSKYNTGKYTASYLQFGIKVNLGQFNSPEEAFEVYKLHKEKHIKIVADIWKDKITLEVYQALYNYQVEITD